MPHDRKGVKIEFGDWIKAPPYNYAGYREVSVELHNPGKARMVVGRFVGMREGQSCFGDFVWQSPEGLRRDAFEAGEAEVVLKASGLEPQI